MRPVLAAGVLALLAAGAGAQPLPMPDPAPPPSERILVVGSGPVVGAYHGAASALARAATLGRQETGLRLVVESTGGNEENLRRLRAGDLDFAVAGADMIFAALEGIGTFADDGRFAELRTVLTLFPEPLIVLVRADSEAETVADLGSARIGQGAARSRGRAFFEEVLAVHGLDPGALPGPRSLPFARQGAALCAGEIDVVALLASHPSGTVNDLAAACELRALALDETAAEAMQRAAPHLVTFRLPGGLYPGLDEPVVLIGPAVALVTTAVTPASVVERVIGTVLAHEAELRGQYPAFTGVDRAWLLGDRLAAPHHTGVRGFLEE